MEKIRIGYMGGVWDLFHVGHLNYMKEAKKYCDFLIVDVTPDKLVYEQKNKYPMISEQDRLEVVRAIKYVDRANLSDEGRDFSALERYGFNVLFISEDHKGKEYYDNLEVKMREKGVEVVYIPYTTRISSTMIQKKLK